MQYKELERKLIKICKTKLKNEFENKKYKFIFFEIYIKIFLIFNFIEYCKCYKSEVFKMQKLRNVKNNLGLINIEEYKRKRLDEEIERKILKSEDDYNNGRIRNAEDVFKEWKLKYGI